MKSKIVPVLIAAILLFGCSRQDSTIKIGFSGQMSGPGSTPGAIVRNGAILAAEKVNARGGIRGRPVQLIIRDDRGDPGEAVRVDRELSESGVEAIIGHTISSMSAAALDYINEKELLMLSPTSSAEYLMGRDDFFFSLYPGNRLLAGKAADFAYRDLGLRDVNAIVDSFNEVYTEDYLRMFRQQFEALGGRVAAGITYDSTGDPDFKQLTDKLLENDPDGLILISASLDTAMIIQQLYKREVSLPLIGTEWSENQELIDQGGPLVERIHISNLFNTDIQGEKYQVFIQDYTGRFGTEPTRGAAIGYESVMVIAEALERKKSGQHLKEVLLGMSFEGLQENISFDANGDVNRKIYIHTVRDDSFVNIRETK